MRKSRRLRSGIARGCVVVAITVLLAACGVEGSAPPGTGQAASGEPIVVGLINMDSGPAPAPEVREASEAAVKYINAELNGLGGRPIKLETCITNGSPESSAGCANKMVERKVVAVRGGIDLGSSASLPILKAAGIPYLFGQPLLPADFTTDGAFAFGAGGLGNAVGAAYAADKLNAKRVSILYADGPAGRQLAENFVKPALINQGIRGADIKLVAEKVDAADLSLALAAATRGDPDAIIVVFPPPACSRIMQATAALGVKVPMFHIGPCGDPSVVKAGGAGADGMYFNSPVLNIEANKNDPDVRTYLAKLAKYAASLDPASYNAATGFASTMMVYKRLAPLDPSTLSPATVTAIFKSATNAPGFMTHNYTCDGKQAIPAFVSVCDTHIRLYQFKGGHYRDVLGDWVSAGAALRP